MRQFFTFSIFIAFSICLQAQEYSPIFRYPDVSKEHIVFVFGQDLWLVAKEGGIATRLSSPPGEESWARFSPDGKTLAFTGNYDGQSNIYLLSISGGLPKQLTYHGMQERVVDWYPDGKHLLYSSSKNSGKQRFSQFYKVPASGGLSERLPIAHAEMGAISGDGKQIAFTDKTRLFRTWKRYRGGTASDIHVFNLETMESQNITQNDANDELPMWVGNRIYYLSDQGEEMRFNIWMYDLDTKTHSQITTFTDKDIHFPASGPDELVFEAGGDLYLLNYEDHSYKKVDIKVIADFDAVKPRQIKTNDYIQNAHVSPDGKRILIEARGEIYSVPAEKGFTQNLTRSSGSAERSPAWSPDGKWVAFWSDESGEYELHLHDTEKQSIRKVTSIGEGFRYTLHWSPDSKKLAYINQALEVQIVHITNGKVEPVVKQQSMMHYALNNFTMDWSSDSRWLTFTLQQESGLSGVGVYSLEEKKMHYISGGLYNLTDPVFDPSGKYLYALVGNHFSPIYSSFDNSWVYTNNTQIAAITLRSDVASPLAPENDEVSIKKEEEKSESDSQADKKATGKKKEKEDKSEKKEEDTKPLVIDFEGIEGRLVVLPVGAGRYGNLAAADGKIIYAQYPNAGERNGESAIKMWKLEDRKEETILSGTGNFMLTADRKKMLVQKGSSFAVIDIAPNQKMEKTADLSGLRMTLDPKAEWQQLFNESWRIQRDFFYDKNMHGIDWAAVKQQYQKLLDRATGREDVNYVIGEMIGELNASHAYRGGGDYFGDSRYDNVGYLGIDWNYSNGHYQIEKIIKAADWDTESRSPLSEPGVSIKEGTYILAVNGAMLNDYAHPFAAFAGLANKTVELWVNDKPQMEGMRKVLVKTMGSETRLRNLAWIEDNRRYVEEASEGRIGYIYVPSTGWDGQYELVRMFYGQYRKEALIIDERFNNGGQIPDRFIELLNRQPLAFWKTRDGADWQWPPVAHFGPKAMLINGWSGSGGDAFPDYFRKAGLGPLIGSRTWGGLIGISGAPALVDGGNLTSPTFRMFHPDGEWFPEGHGVDPDILVPEDYSALAKGRDAQLDRAIEELLKALKEAPFVKPEAPEVEKRN